MPAADQLNHGNEEAKGMHHITDYTSQIEKHQQWIGGSDAKLQSFDSALGNVLQPTRSMIRYRPMHYKTIYMNLLSPHHY